MSTLTEQLSALLERATEQLRATPAPSSTLVETPFTRPLREHLGSDPRALQTVSERIDMHQQADLQRSLDHWLAQPGRAVEMLGFAGDDFRINFNVLASTTEGARRHGYTVGQGAVRHRTVPVSKTETMSAIDGALLLLTDGATKLAVLIAGPPEEYVTTVRVEVAAPKRADAERFMAQIRAGMRKASAYRGKVIALSEDQRRGLQINFVDLPTIAPESVILPPGLLDRIERHTARFAAHREALRKSGQHLKRGLLLHGPPGTGKTFTAMYLAGRMPDRTVMVVTGRNLRLIESVCAMARRLEPATILLEDVDLIAEERSANGGCNTPFLFELLNAMDGLDEDADLLFVLTTNRPEALEPALAARPGRIDMALEVPLPDASCRGRILSLYGKQLQWEGVDLERIVARTEGVSAAFLRELVRRAALLAADEGDPGRLTDARLDAALRELTVDGGAVTRALLGAKG